MKKVEFANSTAADEAVHISSLSVSTVSGHKYFIKVRIPIDFSAFFSVQEN